MITRLEVIDYTKLVGEEGCHEHEKVPTRYQVHQGEGKKVQYSLQDDGRTLKVFITKE